MSDFWWFVYIGNTQIFDEKEKANKQKMCCFTKTFVKKRETGKKMRLQTDREFEQNKKKTE